MTDALTLEKLQRAYKNIEEVYDKQENHCEHDNAHREGRNKVVCDDCGFFVLGSEETLDSLFAAVEKMKADND